MLLAFEAEASALIRGGKACERGTRYGYVFLDTATAGADRTNDGAITFNRNPAAKDHDPGAVCRIETKPRITALGDSRQLFRRSIESARRPGFVNGDVHTAEPCAVHPYVGHEATSGIDDGQVVWNVQFPSFGFTGNGDAARIGQI